tara:strand:- start:6503 stop:9292 length:2790 start_codon:yes stop_codon:yes gene_type:complete
MALIDSKQLNPRLTGSFSLSGSLDVSKGDLSVNEYIRHTGDTNTNIRFTDNRIRFDAGNMTFIGIHDDDSAPFTTTINPGSNKINFKVMDENNDVLLKTNSETFSVELYHAGNKKLETTAGGLIVTGSVTSSLGFSGDGSGLTGIASGIFQTTGSIKSTTNDLEVTGSLKVNTASTGSTAISTNNITNGYPTSNNWGENLGGSYFNNFNNTTHVSEILRFIAGAMSHSLDVADAAPNTKYWNTVSTSHTDGTETSKSSLLNGVLGSTYENARLSNSWTGSAFIDLSTTGSYREVQDYLQHKNWVQSSDRGTNNNDVGTNPFHGTYASRIPSTNITTQGTFGTLTNTITANAGGSTSVSSNSNYFGLGNLTSGGATEYSVRVIASQSFSDTYDDETPDASSTFHTHSFVDYTQSSFGTSNGLILSKIVTSQPAVIPSAYQDGDFNSVAGPISGRKYTGGSTTSTNVSASGYYKLHDVVVGLKTGSMSDFEYKDGSDGTTRFYLYTGGLPTDITNSQPTAVVTSSLSRTSFSATSRSLSGAPYILTTSYGYDFTSEVSKSFDPAFGYGTSVMVNSNSTDQWDNIGVTSLSNTTTTVANTGVSSTGATNYVIDRTRTTKRSSGDDPQIQDIAVASSSFTFSLDSNSDNIVQNRSSQETKNYNLKFRATGRNWKNTSVTDTTPNEKYYDATRFGQSSDSGSLAIYSRAQGYDPTSVNSTTEGFDGEDFRIVLADNVTTFTGAYFTTDTFQVNDNGGSVLGNYDLQVKPGYLVDPGGDYGYWFKENFGSGTYKYYIRRFQKSSGNKTGMTINLNNKTLVNWNSTSDGIACALIFKSGTSAGGNTSITTCRLFDPSDTTSNLIESGVSNDNHKNPFSSNIDLYGNTGGSVSSNTYTVPMRNADGMFLDATDDELYVVVRYKGDPSPLQSITLGYS